MENVNEYIFSEEVYQLTPKPVVVVNKPLKEVSAEESGLLSKILAAIKHSLDSVNIVYQPQLDVAQFSFKPEAIICFGSGAKGLGLYEPIEANQVSIVLSESLTDLLKNDASRKLLWQALKKQFKM
jgi:DNA polymerase III psi subunit